MFLCFFFNDTATTEIYTLSLHDALPICHGVLDCEPTPFLELHRDSLLMETGSQFHHWPLSPPKRCRSEEHTSELQSHSDLVCRLLLEKKKHYANDSTALYRNL